MIKLVYHTTMEQEASELEWLREQKIFPAHQEGFDWKTGKAIIQFGVIVSPEQALAIKLRHKLDTQADYRQR